MSPSISVVIPTKNGAATLPALLDALWSQRTNGQVEIVAVDSGSTDDTVDLLRPRVSALLQVAPGDFNHGLTRNLAIGLTRGDVVVLLVQDAVPRGDDFLETLAAPLRDDPAIAGTFARQVPGDEASPIARAMLARWPASGSEPWVSGPLRPEALDAMPAWERLRACVFDNVASAVRRAVWERHPFAGTPIAEDLEWARAVLLDGHRIAFVPAAVVTHSHDRGARHEYRRTRALHARLASLFGLRTIPTRASLARSIVSTLATHLRLEGAALDRWPRAAALAVAWPLGQYHGARDAESGFRVR